MSPISRIVRLYIIWAGYPKTLTFPIDVSVRIGVFPEVSEDDEMHPLLGMARSAYLRIFCSALRTGCN